MDPLDLWESSADAWAAFVEQGDKNRDLLLDPVVLGECGDVTGLRVLDVGCGEGRFCRMLAKRGAEVIGLDPTPSLIALAERKGGGPTYALGMAEDLPYEDGSFDLLISYLALLDVADFRRAIAEMARVLQPGGRAIVANQNAFVTTSMNGWHRGPNGEFLHFPVDRYLEEWGETTSWKGIEIVNYHRPLSAYFDAFLTNGFILRRFQEPGPTDEAIRLAPGLEQHCRVPFFYVATWQKE
ncbi:MAG: class I SAM-dependent methyltransferase [Fimbriimonadaceae bacterium]|nr:class I SAM-dependent methyltransferase [Fimbriimonadaceae bacterium]